MNSRINISNKLWAVTTFFNPAGYKTRRKNYEVFRRHLNIPLLTVYHDPDGRHELKKEDADILVRISDGHPMWQKERLFNLAMEHLPQEWEKIAWLDCDILFPDPQWARRLEAALDESPVVHPFRVAHRISAEETQAAWNSERFPTIDDTALTEYSVVDLWQEGIPILPSRRMNPPPPGPQRMLCGLAWGTRREISEKLPFFDGLIVGSGDAAFFSGIAEPRPSYTRPWGPPGLLKAYEDWAARAWEVVRGRVANLEGTICTLWHGPMEGRNYGHRWKILDEHSFDPAHDLTLSPGGAWTWNSQKPNLHRAIESYFNARTEDA